ncbi:hypothetical protein [Streptomyces canus]|uniref:hypothetical protein n=1 Tax=Streptomyces canus TaxID=58343 RepID=UPI002E2C2694|nr:hypothetical protein [Streptomyces canus]
MQFVAFLGAYRDPGNLNPWAAALLGALLTSRVTFVLCFLIIFLCALTSSVPHRLALTGITAAVVGVIANLALYFCGPPKAEPPARGDPTQDQGVYFA